MECLQIAQLVRGITMQFGFRPSFKIRDEPQKSNSFQFFLLNFIETSLKQLIQNFNIVGHSWNNLRWMKRLCMYKYRCVTEHLVHLTFYKLKVIVLFHYENAAENYWTHKLYFLYELLSQMVIYGNWISISMLHSHKFLTFFFIYTVYIMNGLKEYH